MPSVLRGSGDSSFGGNLSIEGVLTYEDVSSVDSVGVITARSDVIVGGGLSVTGISTFNGGRIDIGTGTSISSPSSNVLTLGTNNGERLRITSGGNVGIGTTSPTRPLTIEGSTNIIRQGISSTQYAESQYNGGANYQKVRNGTSQGSFIWQSTKAGYFCWASCRSGNCHS